MSPSRPPLSAFTPKTLSVFREGYSLTRLKHDAVAGATVAMVALPLSMAIAKASGASPDRGLVTAIVGGFLISLLGGSRFQIGGPAGAFIVVVASIIERQGYDGLLLATLMAGLMMLAFGALRLGTYIKYIPHPVLVGFTSGIATIIFASQIVDLLGLHLAAREPAALLPKLKAIFEAIATITPAAIATSAIALAIILALRKYKPNWPGFLIAIAVASLVATALTHSFGFQIETIGTRFGGIPDHLPPPNIPAFSLQKLITLLPDAATIAFLGAIESLLSAVVADGMTGRRHRSNMELIAQGIANIGSALFGGICATGTIARTATNVRAGGTSPVSGMIHAGVLLVLVYVAAPLASYIPLAALGAVLALVSWNMAERHEFIAILKRSRAEGLVLLATFLLTIFRDLTEGIMVGVVLSAFIFMHRMAGLASHGRVEEDDKETEANVDQDRIVYKIEGAFFFGVAAEIADVYDRIGHHPKEFIFDLSDLMFIDMSAAHALAATIKKLEHGGTEIKLRGARDNVVVVLTRQGIPADKFLNS